MLATPNALAALRFARRSAHDHAAAFGGHRHRGWTPRGRGGEDSVIVTPS